MISRTTISWSKEDADLVGDLKKYKARAIGNRIKRLAAAGLMLERMGITLDDNGVIPSLTERLNGQSIGIGGVAPSTAPEPKDEGGLVFIDDQHEAGFNKLMAGIGLS